MGKVKGTKIKSKITFLATYGGEGLVTDVLRSLPESDRAQLTPVLDLGWYELELFERLLGAIVRVAADGDEQILDKIGRFGAEDISKNAYQVYFRSGDPEVILQKMVPIHSALNDPGEMEISRKEERSLCISVKEPRRAPLSCKVARTFYHRCVELCGVTGVTVEEVQCSAQGAESCEFLVAWG